MEQNRDMWTAPPYEPLRSVPIPEGIPELGIAPGGGACIDSVYTDEDGARMILAEVSGPDAPANAFIDLEIVEDGVRVVGYTEFGL